MTLNRRRTDFLLCTCLFIAASLPVMAQEAGTGQAVPLSPGAAASAARFLAKETDASQLPPSMALADPTVNPSGAAAVRAQPLFWKSADGRYCVRVDVAPGTDLYGTGEIAGPLLRNGKKTVCWNTDAYGYTEKNVSLYQSHPWVLALRPDGTCFGVLADTTWRCEIDLTGTDKAADAAPGAGSIVFRGDGSPYSVFIIDGPTPQDVMKGLGDLIGKVPLPPKWALGYHQCRYSYFPEARVREIAEGFRARKLPCDVIWFDIDYMDKYKVFTFDSSSFPDVPKLNKDLGEMGFHRIWMIDPGIKAEPGYSVFDQGTQSDVWVKNAKGETYKGEVWPGYCTFPDYTQQKVRQWWQALYVDFMAQGVSGVWNDMNEPAVFNVPSKTMPEDNQHKGGPWELGGTLPPGPHLQYHNVYGMLMAKGTFDGITKANPTVRPFVLTRAGYIGSQRYAATWTGDNSAEWDDLEQSVSMSLNLGLSGQPFCGPDIGGFNGNGDKEGKLFARWFGLGTLLPFSRGHTGKGNIDKEPWSFGPEVEATCRLALERRYRLLPYLYTLFEESSRTGMPVMRPLFFADSKDPVLRSEDDAFTLGDDLLVVGKLTPERDRVVAMPKLPSGQKWQPLSLAGEALDHPDLPSLYVRPGAIIPIGSIIQHTAEPAAKPSSKPATQLNPTAGQHPIYLVVALDQDNRATGTLYEDEDDGYNYRRGLYLRTTYTAAPEGNMIRVSITGKEGSAVRTAREMRILVLKDGWFYPVKGTDGQSLMFELSKITPRKLDSDAVR